MATSMLNSSLSIASKLYDECPGHRKDFLPPTAGPNVNSPLGRPDAVETRRIIRAGWIGEIDNSVGERAGLKRRPGRRCRVGGGLNDHRDIGGASHGESKLLCARFETVILQLRIAGRSSPPEIVKRGLTVPEMMALIPVTWLAPSIVMAGACAATSRAAKRSRRSP